MNTIDKKINLHLTQDHLILTPVNRPTRYSLIFLHGIGMSVRKMSSVFLSSSIIGLLRDFKIYMPQAPRRPIDMYGGALGPSWNRRSEESFKEAGEKIKQMLDKELEEVDNDPKRIFLGGFSQGSGVALDVGLSLKDKIGGIIVFGGFISQYTKNPREKDHSDILIVHGGKDEMLPWETSQENFKPLLGKSNVELAFIDDMQHDLNNEEAKKAVYDFIRARAPVAELPSDREHL